MADGKKIIKLSQFYHRNYAELKAAVAKKVKYLGKEKFSIRSEFRELFT